MQVTSSHSNPEVCHRAAASDEGQEPAVRGGGGGGEDEMRDIYRAYGAVAGNSRKECSVCSMEVILTVMEMTLIVFLQCILVYYSTNYKVCVKLNGLRWYSCDQLHDSIKNDKYWNLGPMILCFVIPISEIPKY